jgi:Xaa-Pro aminopeptidase
MRRAAAVSSRGARAVMRAARPERERAELDALLDYTFRRARRHRLGVRQHRRGRRERVHPATTARTTAGSRDGELCLVDAGCEWDFYASDVTRTFPVNGRFSARAARALYELVLRFREARALEASVPARRRPGARDARWACSSTG